MRRYGGEMSDERRKALGIPIHKEDRDHTFVDGYCVCGASQRKEGRTRFIPTGGRRRGNVNLDLIEGNSYNR